MDIRILNRGAVLLSAAVLGLSCTAGYFDINRNPYGVTDDEMQRDGYAVKAALLGISNGVISPDVNTTQFTECLLGGTMAGYLADANGGWKETISNYNPTDNWTNVFMKSDKMIPVIYSNYRQLHQVTDDPILHAVGEIIKIAAMHRVTDTYGPIPYSRIGQNGEINVPYDSQEDVYKTMFKELDAAIETLMPNKENSFSPSADPVYGGNINKWIKFANSLKLRLALRISYANPELSRAMAEDAVKNEVGVMVNNGDNAVFKTWGTDGNPIDKAVEYNKLSTHDDKDKTACQTMSGDSHAAADIICYMNGYKDPRRTAYFTKSEWDGFEYIGLRRCISIPDHKSVGHKFSGVNIGTDSPVYWMTAAEVSFLKAEATAVFGYEMNADAQTEYENGVRLSFEQWGVSGAEEYLLDDTSKPESYSSLGGVEGGDLYSEITIKWENSADKEIIQERIITQKWIANWLLGNESWADWRRTGYPRLLPATESGNFSAGKGRVDNRKGARRMPYPTDEAASNSTNYTNAVQNLLKGDDVMSTRLWFDCKPNHPLYQ